MRDSGHGPPMMVSVKLIILLTALFALQCINDVYIRSVIEGYLALTPAWIKSGYVWQLFTFQFLHVGLFHLAGNLLMLWFIGRTVESWLGAKRFLVVYLASGLAGGILHGTLMLLFTPHFGLFVFGASAGTSGIFAVFAMMAGEQEIRLNFILPVKAKSLLWIMLGISIFFTLVPTPREGVAHAAHLGGLIFGIWFVRQGWHRDFIPLPWEEWWASRRKKSGGRPFIQRMDSQPARSRKTSDSTPNEDPDFIASQVDPILDKISEKGLHSLTDKEREILEKARKQMGRG